MNASELRIGNYVNYTSIRTVKQGQIYCLNYNKATIGNISERNAICYTDIDGIPLTEELLVKLGFINDGAVWSAYDNYEVFYCIEQCEKGWHNSINGGEYSNGMIFRYIHQLQNQFYSLTFQELELT